MSIKKEWTTISNPLRWSPIYTKYWIDCSLILLYILEKVTVSLSTLVLNTVRCLFRGLQTLRMVQKREFVEIIFMNDIGGVRGHSLQYMWTCAYYTRLATLEDIMADKLTEERFCSKKISYLQWIKELPSLVAKPIMRCPLIHSHLLILISSWSITW